MKRIITARDKKSGTPELNMASLIDMIFILLIFFLVTTSFARQAGVEVQRPSALTAQVKEKTHLIIAVTREGQIFVEDQAMDIRSIRSHMERFLVKTPEASVVIAADQDSRTGIVIQALDACRLAGVKDVSVAARRP